MRKLSLNRPTSRQPKRKSMPRFSVDPPSPIWTSIADDLSADTVSETCKELMYNGEDPTPAQSPKYLSDNVRLPDSGIVHLSCPPASAG